MMPSLKEYFSFRKTCNKANKSDEKCQENNQEQKKYVSFVMKKNVKIMQRTVFGFNVINVIYGEMFIASYILRNKQSQKRC